MHEASRPTDEMAVAVCCGIVNLTYKNKILKR
jgi:hypothetical protein